jgi:23S rRNA (adenine2503-C2)-methyltransferase
MMKMVNLIGTPQDKLKELFISWGEKPYRADQVFTWVYHRHMRDFGAMTNLSKPLRTQLQENFYFELPKIREKAISEDDSIKYLFELSDGATIESVWMPSDSRNTLCISTQVGCRLACTFCQTATLGLKRNLTAGEIVGQILAVNEDLSPEHEVSNVVVMGMGEPLDNYDPVVDALRLMVSPQCLRISTRRVTLSTSGLVDKIDQLKTENLHVNLAISLNATDDVVRDKIMPINKKYPIKTLLQCLMSYPLKATRRLTFEYVLLKDINDSMEDAVRLAQLLKSFACKINLIPFNASESSYYRPPAKEKTLAFQNYLISKNYSVFIRQNRGQDILGACGQLAANSQESIHESIH